VALAVLEARPGDAAAGARLAAFAGDDRGDIERRKAAWLAAAYAAELDCSADPARARGALDRLLARLRQALPEGGALPREVRALRDGCGGGGA
jgi:serine/threonine-protein kinase